MIEEGFKPVYAEHQRWYQALLSGNDNDDQKKKKRDNPVSKIIFPFQRAKKFQPEATKEHRVNQSSIN